MYQNMISTNPIIGNFNTFMTKNPTNTPFQSNKLINENILAMNDLSNSMQKQRSNQNYKQATQTSQTNQKSQTSQPNQKYQQKQSSISTNKNINVIEELLKPQKILRENKDVKANFTAEINERDAECDDKYHNKKFQKTNQPYKNIIKDKIITKNILDVTKEDLIVHKVSKIDSDLDIFTTETSIKDIELKKINEELLIEWSIENYDKNKKKYDYKETLIKNMAFEATSYDENKQDYIEFYTKKQKEAELGTELCDRVLHKLLNDGLIKPEELPTEMPTDSADIQLCSQSNLTEKCIEITSAAVPPIERKINSNFVKKSKPVNMTEIIDI